LLYGLYDVQVLIYLIAWKSGELRCQAVTESSAGDRNPQLFRLLLVRMTLICLPNMQGKCDIQYEIWKYYVESLFLRILYWERLVMIALHTYLTRILIPAIPQCHWRDLGSSGLFIVWQHYD